jgi:hypothetical protein
MKRELTIEQREPIAQRFVNRQIKTSKIAVETHFNLSVGNITTRVHQPPPALHHPSHYGSGSFRQLRRKKIDIDKATEIMLAPANRPETPVGVVKKMRTRASQSVSFVFLYYIF